MFARMMRPSRRHIHEQISQTEEEVVVNDDNPSNIHVLHSDNDDNSGDNSSNMIGADATMREQLLNDAIGENRSRISISGGESRVAMASALENNVETGANEVEVGEERENEDPEGRRQRRGRTTTTTPTTSEQQRQRNNIHPSTSNPINRTSLLSTERDVRLRRQSTCSILIFFFLIRLWVETLIEKDVGLLFLSLVSTVWTYRWFVNRREAEDELDRQFMVGEAGSESRNGQSSLFLHEDGEEDIENDGRRRRRSRGDHSTTSGADAAINFDPDLGLMSFQAQLALAILESQRQMFENGGYNAGNNSMEGPGVTDEAKGKWQIYEWGADDDVMIMESNETTAKASKCSNYGSVNSASSGDLTLQDNVHSLVGEQGSRSGPKKLSPSKLLEGGSGGLLASFDGDEQECPSCSICLCEYERGEKLIRLPCDHLYHEQCLNSWTQNHVRCPLCNYDLMDGFEQPVTVQQQARQHADDLREFRIMALSALGRRLRPRRMTNGSSTGRGSSNGAVTAAELAEATDDSIV